MTGLAKCWGVVALAAANPLLAAESAQQVGAFDLGKIEVVEVTGERDTDNWIEPMNPAIGIEDIQLFDRQNVAEAVSLLPGVTVQNAGARNERLIFVRGFNSRQVPLFMDGISVYVPYDGNIDLARMTTADIAEVSVTKGFTSMLYGANTLGGSINVISRRPTREFEFDAGSSLGFDRGGDQNSGNAYLNTGTNQGLWYAQFGASYYDQDYFKLPSGFDATPAEDGGRRDNSSYRDAKGSLKLGWTPSDTDEYALGYQNQQSEKDTPPYAGDAPGVKPRFWQWPEYDKESWYFIGRNGFGNQHYARVRLYYDSFKNSLSSYDDGSFTTQDLPFAFNSNYDDYSWGSSLELGTEALVGHDLRAALSYKDDVHREVDDLDAPRERYEDEWYSAGVEDRYSVKDDWTLLAGVSYDQLEGQQADDIESGADAQFELASESAVNAQAGVLHEFSDTMTGRFSYSHRSRFPTIKDRYSFRLGSAIPNPDLDTETANNFELGLEGNAGALAQHATLSWGGAVFYSEIDDAIESVTIDSGLCSRPPCSQLQNIGKQTNQGIEAVLTADFGQRWRAHVNYTYLDKDNESNSTIKPLDVPAHTLFSYISFMPQTNWELLAYVEYGGQRYSSTAGDRIAESFAIGTLKAVWRPQPGLQLEGSLRNVTDESYAYEEGFYEAGRSGLVTVRWQY